MIDRRPVMKADITATIPASIESAKTGLAAISAGIVSPEETDLYNEFVVVDPMINNMNIAIISAIDHLPNTVLGEILQGCFIILSSSLSRTIHASDHSLSQYT
jgi:hypothetical protein